MDVISLPFLGCALLAAMLYHIGTLLQLRSQTLAVLNLLFFLALTNPAGHAPTGLADADWLKAAAWGLLPYAAYMGFGLLMIRIPRPGWLGPFPSRWWFWLFAGSSNMSFFHKAAS